MSKTIKYVADITNVQEVTLLGTVDLQFWQDRVKSDGFVLSERAGRAEMLIIAATMKYMGIRFHEISFSLLVKLTRDQHESSAGAFLLKAFNSSRSFAFAERLFFSTPYFYDRCHVSIANPCEIRVGAGEAMRDFSATLNVSNNGLERKTIRSGIEGWGGPVLLPSKRDPFHFSEKLFYAKIDGQTDAFSFDSKRDEIAINTRTECNVLRAMLESNFVGCEWLIRKNANHAKSKTYRW